MRPTLQRALQGAGIATLIRGARKWLEGVAIDRERGFGESSVAAFAPHPRAHRLHWRLREAHMVRAAWGRQGTDVDAK